MEWLDIIQGAEVMVARDQKVKVICRKQNPFRIVIESSDNS